MRTFYKAQLSSLIASFIDFAFTVFLVEVTGVFYAVAIVAGALAGALTNFVINRYWSFIAGRKPIGRQGYRYGIVWIGSLLLNVGGVYLLTIFFQASYIVSKIIVSLFVGFTFNYVLQKKYVFAA